MEVSGDFSRVVDLLSRLAGCSVFFLGFAFCAGYFYSSAYLQAFDSEWFISGFTFVELVIRGIWNAVCGAIGLLILLVVVQSPSVSERHLLWLVRCISYPFFFVVLCLVIYERFGGDWIDWIYQSPWARAWMMASMVCQAANFLHPDSFKSLMFKVFSVVTLFMLAYGVVVDIPKVSARDHAQNLQSRDRAGMLKAYKEGSADVYYLVDSANGKLLLQKDDKSMMVVDPTNDWRISR